MKKVYLAVIGIYLASLFINLFDSIKYPDSDIGIINLIISMILSVLFIWIIYSKRNINLKYFKTFLMSAVIGSSIVYSINGFSFLITNDIFNIISGIRYPLYLIFVTPFFGFNYFLEMLYGKFSLMISIFYLVLYMLCIFRKLRTN